MKAGVMEIADIYAVNKADRPGADRLQNEIEVMLGIRRGNAYRHVAPHHQPPTPDGKTERRKDEAPLRRSAEGKGTGAEWEPPVLAVSAVKNTGIDGLIEAIETHAGHLRASGELEVRRRARLARHTREVVDRTLRNLVWRDGRGEATLAAGIERVAGGDTSPYQLAQDILATMREEYGNGS
jgi:LAO/AO transport system kinase